MVVVVACMPSQQKDCCTTDGQTVWQAAAPRLHPGIDCYSLIYSLFYPTHHFAPRPQV